MIDSGRISRGKYTLPKMAAFAVKVFEVFVRQEEK
jgi:hypothetical protein